MLTYTVPIEFSVLFFFFFEFSFDRLVEVSKVDKRQKYFLGREKTLVKATGA